MPPDRAARAAALAARERGPNRIPLTAAQRWVDCGRRFLIRGLRPHEPFTLPLSSLMDDLRYPVGRFRFDPASTEEARGQAIESIARMPQALRGAVQGLDEEQLETPYRPGGWTVRQLVHHVADSHVNAYTRFRLTLTEDEPLLRTYDEKAWAVLEDARAAPIEVSLALLDVLHERWVRLLRSLRPEDMSRAARHPDHGVMTVDHLLQQYAWHGRHHVAHVTRLRARENW